MYWTLALPDVINGLQCCFYFNKPTSVHDNNVTTSTKYLKSKKINHFPTTNTVLWYFNIFQTKKK